MELDILAIYQKPGHSIEKHSLVQLPNIYLKN